MNHRYLVRTPGVVHEAFEDEVVVVDLDSGDYFSLIEVGATCWNCLLAGCTVKEAVDAVKAVYEGAPAEIEAGVQTLIGELEAENLIIPAGANETAGPSVGGLSANGEKRPFAAPVLNRYSDMRDLLLIDPIHEVDESGWPQTKKQSDDPS